MPAQKTQIVQKLRQRHFLKILFSVAQLLPAIFYYHLKRMERTDRHETARAEITAIYHENKGRYDYRRITAKLYTRRMGEGGADPVHFWICALLHIGNTEWKRAASIG